MSRLVPLLGQNQPCLCVSPADSDPRFCVPEPAAAEGQLLGGTGGGSQEVEACLPLYRRSALRQTKETDRRVRSFNAAPQFTPPHLPLNLCLHSWSCRKNQQYDCKWYIPLTELTFQSPEEVEPLTVPQVPDEELDAIKVKISHLRSEIQREKVRRFLVSQRKHLVCATV